MSKTTFIVQKGHFPYKTQIVTILWSTCRKIDIFANKILTKPSFISKVRLFLDHSCTILSSFKKVSLCIIENDHKFESFEDHMQLRSKNKRTLNIDFFEVITINHRELLYVHPMLHKMQIYQIQIWSTNVIIWHWVPGITQLQAICYLKTICTQVLVLLILYLH